MIHKLNNKLQNLICIWNLVSFVFLLLNPIFKKEQEQKEENKPQCIQDN